MSGISKLYLVLLVLAWTLPAWLFGASTVTGEWLLLILATSALLVAWLRLNGRGGTEVSIPENRQHRTTSLDQSASSNPDHDETDHSEDERERFTQKSHKRGRIAGWAYGTSILFLLYLVVQGLNVAYDFAPTWPVGELIDHSHIEWLPSSLATPFSATSLGGNGAVPYENTWRYLLIFSGVAALAWATTLGLNRTLLVRRWLEAMIIHSVTFSAVALAHNISGSRLTYWFFYDPANRLGGPQFPNGNQQGAYQIVLLAIMLAACFVRSGARPFQSLRYRHTWLILGAVFVWVGAASGRHRAGVLLGSILMIAALAVAWIRASRQTRKRLGIAAGAGAVALIIGFLTVPPLRETASRFEEFVDAPADLFRGGSFRPLHHEVASLIANDERLYGWGGGCYLYLFNHYYQRVPELAAALEAQRLNRVVFPHADGDLYEFRAEYGIAGMALMAAPLICWLAWLLPRIRRVGPEVWILGTGLVLVLAQASIDPALRNPMVLSGLAGMCWLAVRLYQTERRNNALLLSGKTRKHPATAISQPSSGR